ncbi:MAG: hypothetical protein JXN59_01790 [Anaerolineae bacterium]|nr:hypothetical protein [Anaerolineae bacterium]
MILSPDLVITLMLLWLLAAALLAPLEALGWWAGWFRYAEDTEEPAPEQATAPSPAQDKACFVAYLTGIASVAGNAHLPREQYLLSELKQQLPDVELVDDIFPYSVTNRALTGQRVFAWFWRYVFNRKTQGSPIGSLINLRNLFQVLVSADGRYGPIYNQGAARLIYSALLAHGYRVGSGTPVILLGYSGGGQICLGAAPYLKDLLDAPLTLISLGGVLCSDPGLHEIEHLVHIEGSRDWVQRIGAIAFPGRWPMIGHSSWNVAKTREKITIVKIPGFKHTGTGGYLDGESQMPEGTTYAAHTLDLLTSLITTLSSTQ